MPHHTSARGTEYWTPENPERTRLQRALRVHFWVTVVALVAWQITVLVLLSVKPDVFPTRWWPLYGTLTEGASHDYLESRAVMIALLETLAAGFYYRRGGREARAVAGLVGGALLALVFVEVMLMSVRVPAQAFDLVVLAWAGLGHLAYTVLGRSR